MAGDMCVPWQFLGRSECIFMPCMLQFCWTLLLFIKCFFEQINKQTNKQTNKQIPSLTYAQNTETFFTPRAYIVYMQHFNR